MIDKLLCLAAASSDIFHAGPFQTPLTKFAARGRDNGGNSVLRRPFGRNLLASHHSRSARMPVPIAGMQVGAQVSSSQDIRTCPSASQTIRRSEEHTTELQSLMRSSYAVFCLKKKK